MGGRRIVAHKQVSKWIIAIDGPSGAGKSTLAKKLAEELGLTYLDTGAMYRALALKVLREKTDLLNEAELQRIVDHTDVDLREREGGVAVLLDGVDVSALIRTPEVSQMASKVSALKIVRNRMLELQRNLGRRGGVVCEGRDIGTVVFPEAQVKIYLDAAARERARRRFAELRAGGKEVSFEQTLEEMEERDRRDSERDLAPLRRAQDAVLIDSTALDAGAVAGEAIRAVQEKSLSNL